jgi:rSAM/selenodomain-associated transferase 2
MRWWTCERGEIAERGRLTQVTVVIPVLDEAARVARTLAAVRSTLPAAEVVVVDGGSRDATVAIARAEPGVRVITAPRGRGAQLDAGARAATGDVLLFLHADVLLPPDAGAWIGRVLAQPDVVAGAFRIRTVAEGRRHWMAPLLPLADLRARVTRLPYGDQALFVRREAFVAVGGYPDQPLLEDLELARRLWTVGRIVVAPAVVEVSGRRFLARPLRSTLAMHLFPLLYRAGVSPRVLAELYGNPR